MPLFFDTPVQFIKGVGPHIAGLLARKNISTVEDLLHFFPRAYEDRRAARNISSLQAGEIVSLVATVVRHTSVPMGRSSRRIHDVLLKDESGFVHCKFFRVPFKGYFDKFEPGTAVRVVGKVTEYRGKIEFHHPDMMEWTEDENENEDELRPIYEETEGLSSRKIQKVIQSVIDQVEIPETLPVSLIREQELPDRKTSFKKLHSPPNDSTREFMEFQSPYHRRMIFEEFFWLEFFLARRKAGVAKEKGPDIEFDLALANRFQKNLPFELTADQQKVFGEICDDLKQPHPMNRLVQGDVGSGKTVVAQMTAAIVIAGEHQVALMAPTEILAEQHFKNSEKVFEALGIKVTLLLGSHSAREKKERLALINSGEAQLVIGTHALIQEGVDFKKLGLIIIDEQHRFGVSQRKMLSLKAGKISPHVLIMTATPIPRTLALTVYGDLDVSVIRELPKGRAPIDTRVVYESKREAVMGFFRQKIREGGQGYIIFPLVEESEKIDLKDALQAFETLPKLYPEIRFGLLHGRMKSEEKDATMERFRKHELDVLVSTTVIEVGVDVANATLMMVEHSERFGLSQLHQLRGRVGRGSKKSYCVLMMGKSVSDESRARLRIMEKTTSGFDVAEEDLKIRGPGELLGQRQSGLLGFRIANLIRDVELLTLARSMAFKIVENDGALKSPENKNLKEHLTRSKQFDLGGIG